MDFFKKDKLNETSQFPNYFIPMPKSKEYDTVRILLEQIEEHFIKSNTDVVSSMWLIVAERAKLYSETSKNKI